MTKSTKITKGGGTAFQPEEAQEPTAPIGGADAPPAQAPTTPRKTKSSLLREMLSAPGGASLQSLIGATGWQAHTVRAALTGLRKRGTEITRTAGEAGSVYAIVAVNACRPSCRPQAHGRAGAASTPRHPAALWASCATRPVIF